MGRPKKIEAPQPNSPQENMTNMMLRDSLARYEKIMAEFIPALNNLVDRINVLIDRPVVQNVISQPPIPIPAIEVGVSATQPIDSGTIPQITADLSERQIWYFTTKNIPSDFIKQQCNKERWQDLTKEEAIRLIGEWKNRGEK